MGIRGRGRLDPFHICLPGAVVDKRDRGLLKGGGSREELPANFRVQRASNKSVGRLHGKTKQGIASCTR